jgi:hypothetical protein
VNLVDVAPRRSKSFAKASGLRFTARFVKKAEFS